MCLFSRLVPNPKYKPNKKNGGIIPPITDNRVLYVPIACGNCMECRKQKSREWQTRLMEDIKDHKNGKFVTLTFSNESIKKLYEEYPNLSGYKLDNQAATRAVRLFTERWRKKFKTTIRHWLVTELGHNGTENIHLHGIIWTNEKIETIKEKWNYGYIYPRLESNIKKNYVTARTVNYITKYVNKIDPKHPNYKSIILSSDGIGNNYVKTIKYEACEQKIRFNPKTRKWWIQIQKVWIKDGIYLNRDAKNNKFKGTETNESYRTEQGSKLPLPIYWRNKIYTEEEREQLWTQRLDKEERFVCGERIDISKGMEQYHQLIKYYRKINWRNGFGSTWKNKDQIAYEEQIRRLMQQTRINKAKK